MRWKPRDHFNCALHDDNHAGRSRIINKDLREQIARKDIEEAIAALERGEPNAFGPSTFYDLLVDGKRYPPKAVVGIAARRVFGRALRPDEFSGGEESWAFRLLRERGFEVVRKSSESHAAVMPAEAPAPVWIEDTKTAAHGHGGPGWEFGSCLWSPSTYELYHLIRKDSYLEEEPQNFDPVTRTWRRRSSVEERIRGKLQVAAWMNEQVERAVAELLGWAVETADEDRSDAWYVREGNFASIVEAAASPNFVTYTSRTRARRARSVSATRCQTASAPWRNHGGARGGASGSPPSWRNAT
jgi:hypothetical protein